MRSQTLNVLVSTAGGEKYSYYSIMILFCALGSIIGTFCVLVYCRFDISWSIWPIYVATEGGKKKRILFTFSTGYEIKLPFLLLGEMFLVMD